MKIAAYVGCLVGLIVLIMLPIRADFSDMVGTLVQAGWPLLWLIPYRAVFFVLYGVGWFTLLRPYNRERRIGLGYLLWVTTVRDAIDRLLPVASIGGSLAGVRLLRWRGLPMPPAGATVIVETLLTLFTVFAFTALGLYLLVDLGIAGRGYAGMRFVLIVSLAIAVSSALLLRYGSPFGRLHGLLFALIGINAHADGAAALDREIRDTLQRSGALITAGALQFVAFASGAFEVWFALRLFAHPVSAKAAIMLESMTQAIRHVAFVVPAGVGVQEAGLVLFGNALGLSSELALSVSMAKRMREVLCGLPPLLSWQWSEARRLHR
ncbi:MAG TPA: lysylphosphatidylglycerol synthase domain-containing protein [Steroidobacteraceae bacterium]|nr:lysylphosphatidylglycerol synthase domain-containing protein [Steroidobacteraceae bacterium]